MFATCSKCNMVYVDAERLTYCPHDLIMHPNDLKQKNAGLSLIGREVRFADEMDGPTHHVQACGWNGMITLADMPGEFAPHLFVAAA